MRQLRTSLVKSKKRGCWIAAICLIAALLLLRGGYDFLGRSRQGIPGGPNTLLGLLTYEDGSAPKNARAKFWLGNSISLVPFHSKPTSEARDSEADSQGKLSLVWNDNSAITLAHVEADGATFSRDPASRLEREPFWHGYTVWGGRALAVHHLARVTLQRHSKTFLVDHIQDVPRQ